MTKVKTKRSTGTHKVQEKKEKVVKKIVKKPRKPRCPLGTRPCEFDTVEQEFAKFWPEYVAKMNEIPLKDIRDLTMVIHMTRGMWTKGPTHMSKNGVLYEIIDKA